MTTKINCNSIREKRDKKINPLVYTLAKFIFNENKCNHVLPSIEVGTSHVRGLNKVGDGRRLEWNIIQSKSN